MSRNNPEAGRPSHNRATGPVTPEGKARSAANSLKHGFTSRHDIVDEDERQEYEELREELLDRIQPQDILQEVAFNNLLHAAWSLVRVRRMEDAYIARGPEAIEKPEIRKALELLHRYHARHERSYYKAKKDLEELQTAVIVRRSLPPETQQAFPPLANAMKIHAAKRTGQKAWSAKDREYLRRRYSQSDQAATYDEADNFTMESDLTT